MRVKVIGIPVLDQDKALAFYTEKLGFIKKVDVPVSELLKRVQHDKNRPLLNANDLKEREQRLTSLYVNRSAIYNLATVKISDPSIENVLKALPIKR
jgi:shikimate kinase